MEENEYSDLLNYLSRKIYPRGYSDNQKKTLRRKAKNYEFISGDLYYYLRNAAIPHKVLLSKERRLESIASAHHDDATGRHHGIQKTTTRLLNELHCYWRGFTKDIRHFVKDCSVCKSGGENNFVPFSNLEPFKSNNSSKVDSQTTQQEFCTKADQNSLPGLQCRECHLHFTSKISFRIHQRKHAEGPAHLLPAQTSETNATTIDLSDEKETLSSENTPPAVQSYSNMGSMTFKEEGLTPMLGENQEAIPFANVNPVFPVPEQNYTQKDVLAPAKGKFDFSDSNRCDTWLRTADETLKRIKEENPTVSQWWSHHPDPLLRHEQWKNSTQPPPPPPPPGPFCTPGDSHYIPVSECNNRVVNTNVNHLPDGSRPRLSEGGACMVAPVGANSVVPGPYQMMPNNKSMCECPNCKEAAHPTAGDTTVVPAKAKMHSCHICTKVFRKTWHLKAHVRTHTGERPFACEWPNCQKRFTRSDKLHRHMGMHTGERRFACFVCNKRFVRNDTLTQHLKTHNIYTNSSAALQNNGQPLDGSQVNCGATGLGDPSDLSKMQQSPCKLKLYNCTYPDCERVFKKTWHLKAHMCTHTGEKPFVCTWPFCQKRFTRSDKLHRHMGSHTNGKQFYCPICNKHLAHSDYITHHLQVHDGKDVKPPIGFNAVMYENTQGSSFVVSNLTPTNSASNGNNTLLYNQQQNLDESVDIKPTVASILDASLSHVHAGHAKIRLHKPNGKTYDCQMEGCNKVFKKSWHLKAHVRTHTGERPFACQWPLCGKRFARSDKLYRHMTLHTEGKRFPCTLCSKRFVRKDNLKQHMKTHFKKTLKKASKEEKNPLQLVSLVPPPSLHSFYPT